MITERALGLLYGGIVGDAIGCTYEFRPASKIPATQIIDIDVPPDDGDFTYDEPQGVWTDDTTMTLALLKAMTPYLGDVKIQSRLWNLDFRENCQRWVAHGYLTSTGKCFDIGNQTITSLRAWDPAVMIPPYVDGAQGNGALMRIGPCALMKSINTAIFVSDLTTRQTHHDALSLLCSRYLTTLLFRLVNGSDFEHAKKCARYDLESEVNRWTEGFEECCTNLDHDDLFQLRRLLDAPVMNGDAWCAATLANCVAIAGSSRDVLEGIQTAVRMGGDTDTNASIVGMIIGARDGMSDELKARAEKVINIATADEIITKFIIAARS